MHYMAGKKVGESGLMHHMMYLATFLSLPVITDSIVSYYILQLHYMMHDSECYRCWHWDYIYKVIKCCCLPELGYTCDT